jgi:hypothetical protein
MKFTGIRAFELAILSVLCFCIGCASSGSTRLCGDFQSYQSLQDVRMELSKRGLASGWTEESQSTSPTDRRTPYQLIYLSGAYKLAGVDGRLRFTFYNGQLMEMEFSPQKSGDDYLAALRNEIPKAPRKPSEEIVTDRRTRFRFDLGPNGEVSFTWYDPKLEDQWKKWVASND